MAFGNPSLPSKNSEFPAQISFLRGGDVLSVSLWLFLASLSLHSKPYLLTSLATRPAPIVLVLRRGILPELFSELPFPTPGLVPRGPSGCPKIVPVQNLCLLLNTVKAALRFGRWSESMQGLVAPEVAAVV